MKGDAGKQNITSITIKSWSSFPAKIILTSSGDNPNLGATISFTFLICHFGSRSTDSVLPVFVLMYTLKEFDIVRLPNDSSCNILCNTFHRKLTIKLIIRKQKTDGTDGINMLTDKGKFRDIRGKYTYILETLIDPCTIIIPRHAGGSIPDGKNLTYRILEGRKRYFKPGVMCTLCSSDVKSLAIFTT